MDEKEPQFTVIDRRKFTSEGDIRPDVTTESSEESKTATVVPAAAPDAPKAQTASGIHAVPPTAGSSANAQPSEEEQAVLQPPTAEESAAAHNAYTETSRQMDDILRSKMPSDMQDTNVSFEHVIQSLYMTAVMHLGAGTPQGEKARIDLMGARQTIDMLEILAKKTVGNLMESEQHMLDSALFEARMMFLEVTNAIARSATQATKQPGVPPFDPKGRR